MTHNEKLRLIDEAIRKYPPTFSLRGHEGTFRISREASFIDDQGKVKLYTQRLVGDKWLDFAKCTQVELDMEIAFLWDGVPLS